jgi:hypothetical protein
VERERMSTYACCENYGNERENEAACNAEMLAFIMKTTG